MKRMKKPGPRTGAKTANKDILMVEKCFMDIRLLWGRMFLVQ